MLCWVAVKKKKKSNAQKYIIYEDVLLPINVKCFAGLNFCLYRNMSIYVTSQDT